MPDEDVVCTVGDVVNSLEKIEEWVRALRTALATLDPGLTVEVPELPKFSPPQGGSRSPC